MDTDLYYKLKHKTKKKQSLDHILADPLSNTLFHKTKHKSMRSMQVAVPY